MQFYAISSVKKLLSLYKNFKFEQEELQEKYKDNQREYLRNLGILENDFLEKIQHEIDNLSERVSN
jgi:polyhydroxyalkanoate synthesis regulator phasin